MDLLPDANNKSIYDIKGLLHTKISFEPPHKKKQIAQCSRCQRYGHTHNFCNRIARCVKCAGEHETKNCERKARDNNVKCVLCSGNHPANYKGCQHYKDLQQKQFPTPRYNHQKTSKINSSNEETPDNILVHPKLSYADCTKSNIIRVEQPNQKQDLPHQNNPNDFEELKTMVKNMMEQFSPLLALLTTLVTKMI